MYSYSVKIANNFLKFILIYNYYNSKCHIIG